LPVIAQIFIPNTSISIGGTSILILVSVALQTLRAVESRALMVTYDQYSEPEFFNADDAAKAEKTRRLFRLFGKK
jgi:preprotein translocase subunit SecY